jgi:uncharacterized protein YlzI (FlbEa/FlbD family)
MNFIKIIDNTGNSYYVNPTAVAYLKESPLHTVTLTRTIYKAVLKNDKQILLPTREDFVRVRTALYGD